ncbi:MAG: hypothetical protein ABSE49_17640 [Polyangiaceae bacterium]
MAMRTAKEDVPGGAEGMRAAMEDVPGGAEAMRAAMEDVPGGTEAMRAAMEDVPGGALVVGAAIGARRGPPAVQPCTRESTRDPRRAERAAIETPCSTARAFLRASTASQHASCTLLPSEALHVMRSLVLAAALLAVASAVAVGCSSSSSTPPASAAQSGDDAGASATAEGGGLPVVSFQMTETVPGGGEIFDCQYVQLPNVKEWLVAASHDYTPGSHHLLLYTTDLTAIPAGGGQVQDCYEGGDAGNNIMSDARGVLYGAQTPTGSETYPPGIGLPTAANEVLIFQVHYLNASASSLQANVNVDLTFDPNASDITTQAGTIFFYDPFIDVPAGATATASMRCLIPSDITLLYASSHYHSRGVGYGAYIDPAVDQLGTTPFYTSTSWSSPENASLTMPIAAGARIRFECDYDNSAGTQAYYAGQSALDNEMCMFIGTYYPEMGEAADFCETSPDMFGTGPATCGATLSCFEACGGKLTGFGGGGGGGLEVAVPDCEQACMVESCPDASGLLVPFMSCLQKNCKSDCSDASSSACTSCVAASCGSEYAACQADTCN